MRKSTLFISAMLTMFLMATMFGVVSAYQQIVKNNAAEAAKASAPVLAVAQPAPTVVPTAQPLVVTPEQATTIAVEFLGDSNVYSVESVDYEGAPAYLVTFSSGDLVYVSPMGEVVANTKMEPVIVVASSGSNGGGNGGGGWWWRRWKWRRWVMMMAITMIMMIMTMTTTNKVILNGSQT
jgi:hypothetical protein